jgi:hypothetical protein
MLNMDVNRFIIATFFGLMLTVRVGAARNAPGESQVASARRCEGSGGQRRNEKLRTVGQAVSGVLPGDDKETQLLPGMLNQRDKVAQDILPYKR